MLYEVITSALRPVPRTGGRPVKPGPAGARRPLLPAAVGEASGPVPPGRDVPNRSRPRTTA